MNDTIKKPFPRPIGKLAEARRENDALAARNAYLERSNREIEHEVEALTAENLVLKRRFEQLAQNPSLQAPAQSPQVRGAGACFPSLECLAAEIFIRRAANLRIEGFPDEALTDPQAQRPVRLFWEKVRDHSMIAATVFYAEVDAQPGEAAATAPADPPATSPPVETP